MEKTLIQIIDEEIEKYHDFDYDIDTDVLNSIYARFEQEVFEIEGNEEAEEYLLKATTLEALEYLKTKVEYIIPYRALS